MECTIRIEMLALERTTLSVFKYPLFIGIHLYLFTLSRTYLWTLQILTKQFLEHGYGNWESRQFTVKEGVSIISHCISYRTTCFNLCKKAGGRWDTTRYVCVVEAFLSRICLRFVDADNQKWSIDSSP